VEAYLDNCATTQVCPEAVSALSDAVLKNWGNPSSLYKKGNEALAILDGARLSIAKRLSCGADEIFFTSGGTESNSLAILGAAAAMKRGGNRIIISSVEHPSVEGPVSHLEADGFEVIRLRADSEGRISEDDLFRAVNSKTVLISIMAVNNEVGTIQPVEAARRAVARVRSGAVIHCDAIQAFGKIDLKPSAMGVDLMSISSHKIHGPKGAGALYVRGGYKNNRSFVKISPCVFGGLQERTLRPGTEPVPAIAGFGAAVSALPDTRGELGRIYALREYLLRGLGSVGGIVPNSPDDALPYIVNISVLGINSEPMMNFLSSRGVYVSSGSACSKGMKSRVLKNMGLSGDRISSALRISFSRFTKTEEIDMLISGLRDGKNSIRRGR
jgi:cysteine desulfurase